MEPTTNFGKRLTDLKFRLAYFVYFSSTIKGQTTYIDPRIAFTTKPKVKGKVKVDTFKTALDILKDKNLTGKIVIITGANSGIGVFIVLSRLALVLCNVSKNWPSVHPW